MGTPAASTGGAVGQRRRGDRPGPCVHPRPPRRPRAGLRRRGRPDGRPARPPDRHPADPATAADGILLACLGRVVRAFGPGTAATGPHGRAGTAVVGGLFEPLSGRELEVLRLLAAASRTSRSPRNWWWRSAPSRSTSPTSSTSWGRPTAPRRPPPPASSACCANPRPPPRYHPGYPFGPGGPVSPHELSSRDVHLGAMAVAALALTVAARQP